MLFAKTPNCIIQYLNKLKINAVSHYEPLHLSKYGSKYAKLGKLINTEKMSARIVRLPVFLKLNKHDLSKIKNALISKLDK